MNDSINTLDVKLEILKLHQRSLDKTISRILHMECIESANKVYISTEGKVSAKC